MKAKTTALWFVLAAALFAFIWIFEHHFQPAPPASANLFPGLRAADVTGLQIIPAGAKEITARREGQVWQLEKPVVYPAQATAIQTLLAALEKLAAVTRLTAGELSTHKNADAEFGFENPQFSLIVETGGQRWQLLIGNKTAPGDQVFVRLVGVGGAFVTPVDWLQFLPRNVGEWRDTSLVAAAADACDWIVITNGAKVIELRRDPTNQLWQMRRPLAARANSPRLTAALQQLRAAQSAQWVTDDPKADLTAYGLHPAELTVWLGRGTNFLATVHTGKATPENPALVFARREDYNSVITVAKDAVTAWHGAVNDFRDPHLLELTAPIAEIDMRGETHFTLQHRAKGWSVAGEKFPADAEKVAALLKQLASLRVAEFVKDVATGPDLEGFGLTAPTRQVTLRTVAGDTNSVFARLLFGGGTNRIFVKRADEDFVYAVAAAEVNRLPEQAWEFRERRIWNFSETNVVQVTLHQGGKTRQLVRSGASSWSFAAGSQGIINPPAIEESMHRLGELAAAGWVGRNISEPEKFGLNPNNLSITAELKSGEKFTVDFGTELPSAQTALAAVTLEGERWAFVFPPVLYQLVAAYLTIPANTP